MVLAAIISVCAVALLPVDFNEQECRAAPDLPECEAPDWQPWLVRFAARGY